ncbi:MAG: MltA domain-containing protein [Sneathiella sp.]|uniref:murein transglycosylase A n=1 Tax=Sneathiella sp. TaxID=1964365 RepID=UPI003001019E
MSAWGNISPIWKKIGGALGIVVIASIAGGIWYWQSDVKMDDNLILEQTSYSDIPGWSGDDLAEFLPALLKSCTKILTLPETRSLGGNNLAGTAADWHALCQMALTLPPQSDVLRSFVEDNFTPFQVLNNGTETGLFTGYYEASLKGSRTQQDLYTTPLYLRPPELVMVDLGRFRDDLKGQRIAGQVKGGDLMPFAHRTEIDKGALENRELELVWVDSDIDAFFLQIQGSGIVQLDDGTELRVGYAGQNGHPYFAIGKALIERAYIPREKMSMQAIRSWLEDNPHEATEIMQMNASYVFFRELNTGGPIGAQGVELTPERSLAVDRKWFPLGVPVFLETEVSTTDEADLPRPFRKLMMAQDTGGAIRGPVRGDVFWGYGDHAYEMSGGMKSDGKLWIFLPNAVAEKRKTANPA